MSLFAGGPHQPWIDKNRLIGQSSNLLVPLPGWQYKDHRAGPADQKSLRPVDTQWNFDTIVVSDTLNFSDRRTRTYDTEGRILTEQLEIYNPAAWVAYCRYRYLYDNHGRAINVFFDLWQGGQWWNDFRDTYTYDARGNILTYLEESWNGGNWVNSDRIMNTYDNGRNLLIETQEQQWFGEWDNLQKKIYTWNSSGELDSLLSQSWQDSTWNGHELHIYTYNGSGKIILDLWKYIFWIGSDWLNGYLNSYTYDDIGNNTALIHQIWRDTAWGNLVRYTYSYNPAGRPLISSTDLWNNNSRTWSMSAKITDSYDENGFLVSDVTEWIDTATGISSYHDRLRYINDQQGNSTDGIYEKWNGTGWQPAMGRLLVYSGPDTVWYFSSGYQYHAGFISYVNGIKDITGTFPVKVYPDPATDKITIESDNFSSGLLMTLYNEDGFQVMTRSLPQEKNVIDVSRLSAGIYTIRLENGSKTMTHKFVKK